MEGDFRKRMNEGGVRAALGSLAEYFALGGLAFAQPLFGAFAADADRLFGGYPQPWLAVWLAVAIALLVPPVAAWIVAVLACRLRRVPAHSLVLGGIVGLFVYGHVHREFIPPTAAAMGMTATAAFAVLHRGWPVAGVAVRWLATLPLVAAWLFVASPPVLPMAFPAHEVRAWDGTVERPHRVVLIVLDQLPTVSLLDGNGAIAADVFPNFARLANDGRWFRNATSVASHALGAVPAIVSGRYPAASRLPTHAAAYPDTVFTLLGQTYRVHASELPTEHLCPPSLCPPAVRRRIHPRSILDDSWTLWLESLTPGAWSSWRTRCVDPDDQLPRFGRFVEGIVATGDRPVLDYLHVGLPHMSWNLLPTGQACQDADLACPGPLTGLGANGWLTRDAADAARQRHLLQLQATDAMVGRTIDRLKALGEYEDALVVVTADHGVAFSQGYSDRTATEWTFEQIVWVPLFVKFPAGVSAAATGAVDDRPAPAVDIVPTLADVLGIALPFAVDGRSLLGPPELESATHARFLDRPSADATRAAANGAFREYPVAEGLALVRRARALAPGAKGALAAYARGRYAHLVGEPVANVVDRSRQSPPHRLMHPERLELVDPAAGMLRAARFDGRIAIKGLPDLALAVNGIVASVGPAARDRGLNPAFAMFVPPALLRRGANDFALYVIEGPPAAPRLRLSPRQASLAK